MAATAAQLKERLQEIKRQKLQRRNIKMAKPELDDLDEQEPTDEVETDNDTTETQVKRGPGRPKGSTNAKSNTPTKNFHAIILTKRGEPKHIIVTHAMGKNVRAISANNTEMDPVRLPVGNVYHYDEEAFNQMSARYDKIKALMDQNFGIQKQLKPVNAPKRVARIVDPVEEL